MKRMRIVISVLVCFSVLIVSTDLVLADDTTADDWITSSGNTYVLSGNVGIGVTSPSSELEIKGKNNILTLNSTNPGANINFLNTEQNWQIGRDTAVDGFYFYDTAYRVVIKDGGNVGIGTINPSHKLTVNSDTLNFVASFISSDDKASILLQDDDTLNYIHTQNGYLSLGGNSALNSGNLNINTSSGNIGIGTTNPGSYKLAVNGTIHAKEVVVDTNFADFVFEEDYNLPTLDQVESYIRDNKHLPDIPSTKEIEEEGLSMAKMMAKQMQKIEELTLYVIEQNKEIKELKKKLAEFEKSK